jgi:hypothetical protein
VDERRVELQMRIILVSYRIEQRRRSSEVMIRFRQRAEEIMSRLEASAQGNPAALARIAEARRELHAADPGSGARQ